MYQKTIKKEVFLEGIGVHSGERSALTLKPSGPDQGITIENKGFEDKILLGTVVPEQAMHATIVKSKQWAVSTIEHLVAAIIGLGIDNIAIEIEGGEFQRVETPILDGSALPFVHALLEAGLQEQKPAKKFLTPKNKLRFEEDGRFIEILPTKGQETRLSFSYSIDFQHPLIRAATMSGELSQQFFINEIAPARTFGFLEQLPLMRKHGLAKGANLGNSVVASKEIFLNDRRFKDEFIRHKLLDLIGDLGLLGKNLVGKVKAHKTGHAFNRKVVEHFVNNPNEWRVIQSPVQECLDKKDRVSTR